MKAIVAIVKPFRAQAVLEGIGEYAVDSVLVGEVQGLGRHKDYLPRNAGSEFSPVHLPKIEITVLLDDALCETVLERIIRIARTGRIGDGKILTFTVEGAIDI